MHTHFYTLSEHHQLYEMVKSSSLIVVIVVYRQQIKSCKAKIHFEVSVCSLLQIFTANSQKYVYMCASLFTIFLSCCAIMRCCNSCWGIRRKPCDNTQFSTAWSLVSEIWSYPHLLPWLPYCNHAVRRGHSLIIHRMQDFHSLSSRQRKETI